MLLRVAALALFALSLDAPGVVLAQSAPLVQVDAAAMAHLTQTLRLSEMIDVMRLEGVDYGKSLETDLFNGRGGARWDAVVVQTYDAGRIRTVFDRVLAQSLSGDPASLDAIEAFFGSDLGQTILKLELEARRALLDKSVEEAAKVAIADMQDRKDPRLAQLQRFASVNELVEGNVTGALNANLSFYRGMSDGGAFAGGMTEADMLSEVGGQEPQIRAETEDWLFPYLGLAYQPLSDADLNAYIDFSETAPGKKLNQALFAAFDAVFVEISRDLGRAAAKQISGQDI